MIKPMRERIIWVTKPDGSVRRVAIHDRSYKQAKERAAELFPGCDVSIHPPTPPAKLSN